MPHGLEKRKLNFPQLTEKNGDNDTTRLIKKHTTHYQTPRRSYPWTWVGLLKERKKKIKNKTLYLTACLNWMLLWRTLGRTIPYVDGMSF